MHPSAASTDASRARRRPGPLEQLGALTEVLLSELDNLGPITRRLVRRKLKPLAQEPPRPS